MHTTSQPSSDILFINVSAFSCFLSQSTSRILYFFIYDPTPFKFFSSYHTLLFSNLKESCLNKTSKSNSYEDGIIHVSPSIITKSRFIDKFIIKQHLLKSNFFSAGVGFFTGVASMRPHLFNLEAQVLAVRRRPSSGRGGGCGQRFPAVRRRTRRPPSRPPAGRR